MDENSDEIDAGDCHSLWLSVIAQAFIDAKSKSNKPSARKARAEAVAWLNQHNEGSELAEICDLAGVYPSDVKEVFKLIRNGEKTFDFRILRKGNPGRIRRTQQTTTTGESS